MTYAIAKDELGRAPLSIVEIDLPFCGLSIGTGLCQAVLAGPGLQCFNTFRTCQDPVNFDSDGGMPPAPVGNVKTYRFCEMRQGLPVGIELIPCLEDVDLVPTKILPDQGLGHRASVSVTLSNFTHHDRGIDPYVASRSYNPEQQGTFFGKLIARNKTSYVGRELRILTGYLTEPFDWANFQTRRYVIDRIDGPNKDGTITITAKDPLVKLADAQVPAITRGNLLASMTAVQTSLTLDGNETEYTLGGGYVRIGSELIQYASRTGAVLNDLTRGVFGSTASTHGTNDAVQLCAVWQGVHAVDILAELLTDYAGIPASFIPTAQWDDEAHTWLSGYTLTNVISKPEKVKDVVEEICRQCLIYLWWNEIAQSIPLKTISPTLGNAGLPTINDAEHIIGGSIEVKDDLTKQITRLIAYFDRIDYTATRSTKNYRRWKVFLDGPAESEYEYDKIKPKEIFCDWLDGSSAGNVLRLTARTVARYRDGERTISFSLDVKDNDNVWAGDKLVIESDALQDEFGAPKSEILDILSAEEKDGSQVEYFAAITGFSGRYGFVSPNGTPDFGSASDDQKMRYGFISNNSGLLPDGTDAYKIA